MITLNETFKTGNEFIYNITSVPEITTDTFYISAVNTTSLVSRIIDNTTFGLTCNETTDFTEEFTVSIVFNDDTENPEVIDFEWVGIKESVPFIIKNTIAGQDITVGMTKGNSCTLSMSVYTYVGEYDEDNLPDVSLYTEQTNTFSLTIPDGQALFMYSDTMTAYSENHTEFRSIFFNIQNDVEFAGDIMSLLQSNTLYNSSFKFLFYNCKFTTAPALPAMTLTDECYMMMFSRCTAMTTPPVLPARTLAENCYNLMFHYCTAMITPPNLPAETLAYQCYANMFQNCTAMTTPPVISATTLAEGCCFSMFANCSNLRTAPALPVETLTKNCYQYMFYNCGTLTTPPELPSTHLAYGCYQNMFYNCYTFTTPPTLSATTLAEHCYNGMFQGCTNLRTAPSLPAMELSDYCYQAMFYNCTALTTAPDLPATTISTGCYTSMFYGCESLVNIPSILPAPILQARCYYQMFMGCLKITTAPVLPALALNNESYTLMFRDCVLLNYIKAMFLTTPSSTYTNNWITNVATSGTFVMNEDATWEPTNYGYSVPSGWTVVTATE